ncbi:hypothetical protein QCA50_003391 [Cerrena zonata]|uniref:Elongin-A n=1 Tax=Cerrena zonata TaxID=2478898 RepID=A0AAW0GW70_9APHY
MNVHDDVETSGTITRKVPSLVSLCQRVAISNSERLTSLGDHFRIDLILPILQYCSAETLFRFEQASPQLIQETSEFWHALCFKVYPLLAQQNYSDEPPESWRDAFLHLRDLEEQRLEAAGNRLRTQREKEEQRKKDSQIKITDKLPPHKRARAWGSYQPKTLLQKTRSDAVKMQKGVYASPLASRMPVTKGYRSVLTGTSGTTPLFPTVTPSVATPSSNATSGSRVTVTAVSVKRPSLKPSHSSNTSASSQSSVGPVSARKTSAPTLDSSTPRPDRPLSGNQSHRVPERRSFKPPNAKKDPMAALFLPKSRAFSQLPTDSSLRTRP